MWTIFLLLKCLLIDYLFVGVFFRKKLLQKQYKYRIMQSSSAKKRAKSEENLNKLLLCYNDSIPLDMKREVVSSIGR
jgi:hypothetical protein